MIRYRYRYPIVCWMAAVHIIYYYFLLIIFIYTILFYTETISSYCSQAMLKNSIT